MTNLHVPEDAVIRLHAPLVVLDLPDEPEDGESEPALRLPELSV